MRHRNAFFANFILRFGGEALLDYLHEIVLPAFTDASQVRTYGTRTRYFIYQAKLVELDGETSPPVWGIMGQFIKDTEITRHQIFEPQSGVVPNVRTLRNAPSAFFVLILNNHRLIYYPETPDAPDLTAFKATVKRFVSAKYELFINELQRRAQEEFGAKISKKRIREQHQAPTLEIVALTGEDSISAFVNRYHILKSIEFRVIKPNSEIDGHEIFRQLREMSDQLKSRDTKLRTANSDGLSKAKSKVVIKEATAQGNQEVTLDGVDEDGNKLRGNNEEFAIAAPIPEPPATKTGLAKRLYETFAGLVKSGVIKIGLQEKSEVPIQGPAS